MFSKSTFKFFFMNILSLSNVLIPYQRRFGKKTDFYNQAHALIIISPRFGWI